MKIFPRAGAFIAAMLLAGSSLAEVNGINYDPAHSVAYNNARNSGNLQGMIDVINADLVQINKMGFKNIKTFYSTFCTDAPACIQIAKLAKQNNLKVLLGVYEFTPSNGCNTTTCPQWTSAQVNAVIESGRNYAGTVIGIVVGNEDMFDWQGVPQPDMQQRIANDIQTIRNNLSLGQSGVVTSAQRQSDWGRLKANDPYNVLSKIDTIGANIYPFWGGSPEKINGQSVANNIEAAASALKTQLGKDVIITEEGWPSCGNNAGMQDMNIASEIDYYTTWRRRLDKFDSYYFAAYDNVDAANCTASGDANNYFGLCTAAGTTKDAGLCDCNSPTIACSTKAFGPLLNKAGKPIGSNKN
jgi:exo-beta-1,3-glucanase (GH17 family)